jgi:catechol 2,3-dioxygenase-like lactoylglutathione lyase family enzyme
MIDHVSLPVRDLAASAAFYERLLAPLGYLKLVERPATVGFGKKYPELWLNLRSDMAPASPNPGAHVALRAASEDAVRAFHAAALAGGGASDGEPGPRQAAMTTYFGAFIRDPDGNKLEAASFPVK